MRREDRRRRPPDAPADALVDDLGGVDPLDLLIDHATRVLDVTGVAVLLVGDDGLLRPAAAGDAAARRLADAQAGQGDGPGAECVRTGHPVSTPHLTATADRWPALAAAAAAAGVVASHAVPLRHGDRVIGVLDLHRATPGPLPGTQAATAAALADLATVAVLQHRDAREARARTAQLQDALDSRVAIEQATGVIAAGAGVDMAEAFARLRRHARANRRRLADVAQGIIDGSLPPNAIR